MTIKILQLSIYENQAYHYQYLSDHRLVCRYNCDFELIYTLKFSAFRCCSASHSTKLWELQTMERRSIKENENFLFIEFTEEKGPVIYLEEEVLITYRSQCNSFILNWQTFFCFDCLMKSITPSSPLDSKQTIIIPSPNCKE